MRAKKIFLLLFLFSWSCHSISAQIAEKSDSTYFSHRYISASLGAAFNAAIYEMAPDLRFYFPLTNKMQLVGEYNHYGLNAAKNKELDTTIFREYYISLDLKYDFTLYKKLSGYLTSGLLFTNWLNYDNYKGGAEQFYGVQAGIGIQYEFKPCTI